MGVLRPPLMKYRHSSCRFINSAIFTFSEKKRFFLRPERCFFSGSMNVDKIDIASWMFENVFRGTWHENLLEHCFQKIDFLWDTQFSDFTRFYASNNQFLALISNYIIGKWGTFIIKKKILSRSLLFIWLLFDSSTCSENIQTFDKVNEQTLILLVEWCFFLKGFDIHIYHQEVSISMLNFKNFKERIRYFRFFKLSTLIRKTFGLGPSKKLLPSVQICMPCLYKMIMSRNII